MNLLLDAVAVEHYAHGVDVGGCDERKENDGFELMFSHDEYSVGQEMKQRKRFAPSRLGKNSRTNCPSD